MDRRGRRSLQGEIKLPYESHALPIRLFFYVEDEVHIFVDLSYDSNLDVSQFFIQMAVLLFLRHGDELPFFNRRVEFLDLS